MSKSNISSKKGNFHNNEGKLENSNRNLPSFNSYLTNEEAESFIESGLLIQGTLRINPKCFEEAYINAPDGSMDIFIGGVFDRNAALNGDLVGVTLLPNEKWKVLYENLDSFLEENSEYRQYFPSFKRKISGDNQSSSSQFDKIKAQNVEQQVASKKKKRRGGRGRKNKNNDKEASTTESCESFSLESQSSNSLEASAEAIGSKNKNVQHDYFVLPPDPLEEIQAKPHISSDTMKISSSPGSTKITSHSEPSETPLSSNPTDIPSLSVLKDERPDGVIIVPPDELSECDDYTDDDSGCSQICDEDDIVDNQFLPKIDKLIIGMAKPKKPQSNEEHESKSPAQLPLISRPIDSEKHPIEAVNYHHSILVNYMEEGFRKQLSGKNISKPNPTPRQSLPDTTNENYVVPVPPPPGKRKENLKGDLDHVSYSGKELPSSKETKSLIKTECNAPTPLDIMRIVPNWERFVQRRGVVIFIYERNHTRMAAGLLKPFAKMDSKYALFSPTDYRVPRMRIPINECPKDFFSTHKNYSETMFLAKIVEWKLPGFALGQLTKAIGNAGDLGVEMSALMLENGIDDEPFPEEVIQDLPKLPWTIPNEEIARRIDLRSSCIFTIDPESAKDLDDAISCIKLPSGNLRIGVHIADVSHFIQEGANIDKLASCRATSIYLPDRVIPMLPAPLCEKLCSLNPNEDKLAFSVIWEVKSCGEIVGEWFGKTIIRSCAKLSYDHAQLMIENDLKDLKEEQFPTITNGFKLNNIHDIVTALHKLAVILRQKRIDGGALRLDQAKVSFNIDPATHLPNGLYIFEHKDSNKLIEEFMLLANIFVAKRIFKCFPNLAVLRKHPDPHKIPLANTIAFLKQYGIQLDGSSAGSLYESINKYKGDDVYSLARTQLIVNLCSKPMQYAKYICSGLVKDPSEFQHYALNLPLYTHFTSPIRRYADIMVHRLLAVCIDRNLLEVPSLSPMDIQRICDNCNKQKQASKIIHEVGIELYLGEFVRRVGEMFESGMVIGLLDKSVDIYLMRLGIIKRCYMEKLEIKDFINDSNSRTIFIDWGADEQRGLLPLTQALSFLTMVNVVLQPFDSNSLKFNCLIVRPDL